MTTSNTQYRIEFTSITVEGYKTSSTKWFDNYSDVLASKWLNSMNAKVITREKLYMPFSNFQEFKAWKAKQA